MVNLFKSDWKAVVSRLPFSTLERGVIVEVLSEGGSFTGEVLVKFDNPMIGQDVAKVGGNSSGTLGGPPLEGTIVWVAKDNMEDLIVVQQAPRKDSRGGEESAIISQRDGIKEGDKVFQALYRNYDDQGNFRGHRVSTEILMRGDTGETVIKGAEEEVFLSIGGKEEFEDGVISLRFKSPNVQFKVSDSGIGNLYGFQRLFISLKNLILNAVMKVVLSSSNIVINATGKVQIFGKNIELNSNSINLKGEGGVGVTMPVALVGTGVSLMITPTSPPIKVTGTCFVDGKTGTISGKIVPGTYGNVGIVTSLNASTNTKAKK